MKGVLKAVCLMFIMFIFCSTAQAGDFSKISTNEKIVSALGKLENVDNSVLTRLQGQNSTNKPIRVMFRDLAIYGQAKTEAVTMKTNNGGLVILISNRHISAPAEALACLIAHESVHEAGTNTVKEEIQAWTTEAHVWNTFVSENSGLQVEGSKLVKRLNYISSLYTQDGSSSISKIIANNGVYKNLQ